MSTPKLVQKRFAEYREPLVETPPPIEMQLASYKQLLEKGVTEVFEEFANIKDYSGKKFELKFVGFRLDPPSFDELHAKAQKLTYETPMRATLKLVNKVMNEEKEQEIFLSDFPLMTSHGTFIVNGVERVVVPQLARSYGVFFNAEDVRGRRYFGAKVVPVRGAWIEIETEADGVIYVRIDRRRKFPISSLLRVLGQGKTDADIKAAFVDLASDVPYIENSFAKDHAKNADDAHVEIYRRLRDNDLATPASAREFITAMFAPERYDLSPVGRFHFNKRFEKPMDAQALAQKTLNFDDLVSIVRHVITLNTTPEAEADDIDHLGLRRVRLVGEMLQLKLRQGLSQMKRHIQDRMSTIDTSTTLPVQIVNPRALQARIKEFFTTNQLSQFMRQENVLSELEHLRRLSALGAGGLTRERAGFEVRDVHTSHYGRVCPIQTPEGPNIGLILTLSSYARINDFGIIETPYAKVKNGKVTKEIEYINALAEENFNIAHAGIPLSADGTIEVAEVEARVAGEPGMVARDEVNYIDVATNQAYSIATSMIPFIEHNNASRALMGSNMQKQATPCIRPEVPLVATGMEGRVATATGRLPIAGLDGLVEKVDARSIVLKGKDGAREEHALISFARTNDFTAAHHRPLVNLGDAVKKGDILADTSTTAHGQIALGQNMFVAFMSWGGANYEDAIIISERVVKQSKFTSIHIEEFSLAVRDTKLGPEITTHDIPNVGEGKLKDLDEDGVVRIGAEVGPNDILVGKITPKGETELTPEERLLRAIFGEKSRDVKDSSLRMGHGKRGRVIGVKVFSRDRGDKLEHGIIKKIFIEVAQLRNLSVGDKMAGRHGNKGIVSRILPEEDMPYMADGTPVDVILTPLGVPSRMNLGQILEMHLGLAAHTLGYQAIAPSFLGPQESEIKEELARAGFSESGKTKLFDGQTGEAYEQGIAIGYMYMLKLSHMVEDKIHMRSVGPYSLITQQPLGGKAQRGGQRFGEMEVWALEGYGASHTLREMLTIKSDDIQGRAATFDAIVKGEVIRQPNIPASFNVLLSELKGLALDVRLENLPEDETLSA
ncbi:MAG: DNA-directed RNA polymerase subunit beta [Candidatus Vogelbacteria bacterium CG10_big_fil_rev_8_21_14_0_10_51_16]|uniref:DNA-directed RNA polymerase subunit beta n=1 Tax=Candidatus Vogelbacteria bacterium CG10_big_fil_rev_8_21_14_0_10_51_16 TaxID=1975045 RepID=A0A2H0RHN3_9BACT|nr:MAG: DNA-directed RNA polymerase subunit beta [Candidatus Vogelbacteria bacterium CG10_big_fil_rev_8_21_14_0_10_51_16]